MAQVPYSSQTLGRPLSGPIPSYETTADIPLHGFGYVNGVLYHNPAVAAEVGNDPGGAEVTAASVLTALEAMDETQEAAARAAIEVVHTGDAPTAHAASHASGGSDALTLAISQVTGLAAALESIGAETPTMANDFTADTTGITAYSSGTITADYANSRVVIATTATQPLTGVSIGGFTEATGTSYAVLLYVDATPSTQWQVFTKASGGRQIGTINTAGWHCFAWTATVGENGQNPILVAVTQTGSLSLGYIAVFTSPSSTLLLAADSDTNSDELRRNDPTINAGRNCRFPTSGYVEAAPAGTVTLAPGGINMSTSTAPSTVVGKGAVSASTLTSSTSAWWGTIGNAAGGETAVFGDYAFVQSWRDTAVGNHANVWGISSAAYGFYAFCGLPHSITMGRFGGLPPNIPTDFEANSGRVLNVEPFDLYLAGGACHRGWNPVDPDSMSLPTEWNDSVLPTKRAQIHGPDAFDARAYMTTITDTTARDAIATTSRWPGMIVYCTTPKTSYMLNAAFDVTTIRCVSSFARSGTTCTVVFREAHGLSVGQTVLLWGMSSLTYNGYYVIASIPDSASGAHAKSITFEHGTSGTVPTTEQIHGLGMEYTPARNTLWVDLSTAWAKTVTARSRTNNVATLRFASQHWLTQGMTVTVSGMSDSSYDATEVTLTSVVPVSGNVYEISYANTGSNEGTRASPVANAAGTVTPHDCRSTNIDGWDLVLSGGRQTGTGAGGDVLVKTSPVGAFAGNTKGTLVTAAYWDSLVDAVNHKTRYLLYDTADGTYRRPEFGAPDSGGTGYRMLRTPN